MSELELTEDQQIDFSVLYGSLFSLTLVTDYLDALQPILKERNAKNTHTKVIEAENVCNALKNIVQYEFMKKLSSVERDIFLKAVESHSETVYRMFALDLDKQKLVWELIENLNK
jgi:hypothetical protein